MVVRVVQAVLVTFVLAATLVALLFLLIIVLIDRALG